MLITATVIMLETWSHIADYAQKTLYKRNIDFYDFKCIKGSR